jgi:hypothetical protein
MLNRTNLGKLGLREKDESAIKAIKPEKGIASKRAIEGDMADANKSAPGTVLNTYLPY